jgi:DNA recombination protein RmuC
VSLELILLLLAAGIGAVLAAYRLGSSGAGPGPELESFRLELQRLTRHQEQLRDEVRRGRESSLLQLAQATQGIRGDLGDARRTLAEMRAFGQGWTRELERASLSLRRVEAVFAGSASRGAAGENALATALGQLPPDMLETNVAFGSRVVEYALRLPGGRLLPVDSKWSSVGALEKLHDATPEQRRRLRDQACRELRARSRELARYLDPERTLGIGLVAVPDAVHEATRAVHGEGFREGTIVVPYSLALSYLLAVYRIALRYDAGAGAAPSAERLRDLDAALAALEEELEGRLSRGLAQLGNSREASRGALGRARRATAALLAGSRAEEGERVGSGAAGSGRVR